MPSPIARYLVVCPDGRVRHHGAYETKSLAAGWRNACPCDAVPIAHRLEQVRRYVCPTSDTQPDGTPHTIIGCGEEFYAPAPDDGAIDCPHCGICFEPQESGR